MLPLVRSRCLVRCPAVVLPVVQPGCCLRQRKLPAECIPEGCTSEADLEFLFVRETCSLGAPQSLIQLGWTRGAEVRRTAWDSRKYLLLREHAAATLPCRDRPRECDSRYSRRRLRLR